MATGTPPAPEADEEAPDVGTRGLVGGLAEDVGPLLSAHVALAKQEVSEGAKAKAAGAGMLIGTIVLLWLAVQGLLIAAGAALALVVPVWAAALIVSGVLLLLGVILALVGRRLLATPITVDTTRSEVEQTVRVVRERLGRA
ncbi:phage holin family protein [Egibacter rhizosphaerae]|uniref:Phage holin family protein n=1 Tax=Egibacter rhizosphaerae TaxID=1670831 RepID=A0A411YCV1_9ACTN|nr:phage holin family protein [Egibacter rhizosphaerae]QBI19018.1 phage holin family protein [Egibacter rhizosphaerae]